VKIATVTEKSSKQFLISSLTYNRVESFRFFRISLEQKGTFRQKFLHSIQKKIFVFFNNKISTNNIHLLSRTINTSESNTDSVVEIRASGLNLKALRQRAPH